MVLDFRWLEIVLLVQKEIPPQPLAMRRKEPWRSRGVRYCCGDNIRFILAPIIAYSVASVETGGLETPRRSCSSEELQNPPCEAASAASVLTSTPASQGWQSTFRGSWTRRNHARCYFDFEVQSEESNASLSEL